MTPLRNFKELPLRGTVVDLAAVATTAIAVAARRCPACTAQLATAVGA